MKRRTQGFSYSFAMAILLSLAASSKAVALPPGGDEIITTTLLELANGSVHARCLLRQNLNSGAQWLVSSFTSSSGTISGVLNQIGQGTFAFPDGVLSVEMGSGGQGVLSLEPFVGPALVMVFSPDGSVQMSGDVTATLQSMPITFAGALGQDAVNFGLDLGLIEPDPSGGYRPALAALAQFFGAGSACNSATLNSALAFLALIGNMGGCFKDGWVCLTVPAAFRGLLVALDAERYQCLNFSN